ncbi:MAG: PD-(D/E)XK nuclease family protein [Flavobacteriales bacterium]|nr:PD-(D/E)XK nuclease family protein [Flavobacteriales bacterium]
MNTNELVSLDDLLNEVSAIVSKYDKQIEESGERFNIFNILGVSSNEVKLHSRLLAELLSPKGSHGMGDKFLKFFLEALPKNEGAEFTQTQGAIVEIEKWLGTIDNEIDKGGYIDLLIRFPDKNEIIIENKIYAGDQEGQLRRYYNYNPKAKLIYLTLDGKEASDFSTKNTHYPYEGENVPYLSLSYMSDVKSWLEKCIMITNDRPIVRETIKQYIYVINHLSGQATNIEMEKEIIKEIVTSGDKVKTALAISESIHEVKKELLKKLAGHIKAKVEFLVNNVDIIITDDFGTKWKGIFFRLKENNNAVSKEFVYFAFLVDFKYCYLEIGHDHNKWVEGKKIASKTNIDFYKEQLKDVGVHWGKIEDTKNAWLGDWVCRYERKMDKWMYEPDFWSQLADDNFTDKVDEIAKDIVRLLETIQLKG